jgi:rhodanese-related sulfurtransferase
LKNAPLNLFLLTLFIALAGVSVPLSGCSRTAGETSSSPPAQSIIKDVSPVQASALIQKNQGNAGFVILDVRTPQEYADGHLSGAINVDYSASDFRDAINHLDKSKTYLVYCRTGVRSAAASQIMAELGFKDIYNMTGGITDWQAQGLPVVK